MAAKPRAPVLLHLKPEVGEFSWERKEFRNAMVYAFLLVFFVSHQGIAQGSVGRLSQLGRLRL